MSVRAKLWTREEYDRLVAAGALHPEARVQLVQGEIVEITPQSAQHATALRRLQKALETVFREGNEVRAQFPLALEEQSEPEPDIAVVPGSLNDYRTHHPTTALLVVEIADTTLDFDRTRKRAIYAQANPQGLAYLTAQRLGPDEAIAPLAAPTVYLRVGDLLP